eukprot:s3958_g3.t1
MQDLFRNKEGQCLGLLVHRVHALKFLMPEPHRKTYEVRGNPVKFLQEGHKLALISVDKGGRRQPSSWEILAVLEFQGNVKMKKAAFDKYFPFHQVSTLEKQSLFAEESCEQDCVWGWHFELVQSFTPPLKLKVARGSVRGPHILTPVQDDWEADLGSDEELPKGEQKKRPFPTASTSEYLSSSPSSKRSRSILVDTDGAGTEGENPFENLSLPTELFCVLLSDAEWEGLKRGGSIILRPFSSTKTDLGVVIRVAQSYHLVGQVKLGERKETSNGSSETANAIASMYGKRQLTLLKQNSKTLWSWQVVSIQPLGKAKELSWMDNRFRNRIFKLDMSSVARNPQPKMVLSDLTLKQSAQFMFGRWPRERQQLLVKQLKALDGKCLRVGTTCSGSDICVAVIMQTLAYFCSKQARAVSRLAQGLNIKVDHIFSVEKDERKRELILKQDTGLQHLFGDVTCFRDQRGFCFKCGRSHEISRANCGIDWLLSGPSCKDLSKLNTSRGDYLNCYEDDPKGAEIGEEVGMEDGEGMGDGRAESGTSGPTYKYGFKLAAWIAIREVSQEYAQALQSLRSNFQFPLSQIFEKLSPQIAKGRHKELVAMAQARSPCSNNLYVDCASSKERIAYGDGALPCITPSHPIFSTLLQRYLGKKDFLNCQGLWESCFSREAYRHLLAMDSQDVAGNSFSSTACQAVVLSSLTCATGAWGAILRAESSSAKAQECPLVKAQGGDQVQVPAPQPGILRRLKRKQPAPEFDQGQGEKVRRDEKRKRGHLPGRGKGRYQRKVKGVDSRKESSGKSKSVTIWEKEQV